MTIPLVSRPNILKDIFSEYTEWNMDISMWCISQEHKIMFGDKANTLTDTDLVKASLASVGLDISGEVNEITGKVRLDITLTLHKDYER